MFAISVVSIIMSRNLTEIHKRFL